MHFAAWIGQKDCLEILIQNGADVNSKNVRIFVLFLILTNTHKSRGEESDCLKEKREREEDVREEES